MELKLSVVNTAVNRIRMCIFQCGDAVWLHDCLYYFSLKIYVFLKISSFSIIKRDPYTVALPCNSYTKCKRSVRKSTNEQCKPSQSFC